MSIMYVEGPIEKGSELLDLMSFCGRIHKCETRPHPNVPLRSYYRLTFAETSSLETAVLLDGALLENETVPIRIFRQLPSTSSPPISFDGESSDSSSSISPSPVPPPLPPRDYSQTKNTDDDVLPSPPASLPKSLAVSLSENEKSNPSESASNPTSQTVSPLTLTDTFHIFSSLTTSFVSGLFSTPPNPSNEEISIDSDLPISLPALPPPPTPPPLPPRDYLLSLPESSTSPTPLPSTLPPPLPPRQPRQPHSSGLTPLTAKFESDARKVQESLARMEVEFVAHHVARYAVVVSPIRSRHVHENEIRVDIIRELHRVLGGLEIENACICSISDQRGENECESQYWTALVVLQSSLDIEQFEHELEEGQNDVTDSDRDSPIVWPLIGREPDQHIEKLFAAVVEMKVQEYTMPAGHDSETLPATNITFL